MEGLLLKLANQTSTLKKHVDMLGGPKDTVDHRHKISATNSTIQVCDAASCLYTHMHGAETYTSRTQLHTLSTWNHAPTATFHPMCPNTSCRQHNPQDLARQVKELLTQAAGQPSSTGGPGLGQTPEEAARHKRLLQDFAAILQVG